eukprot:GFUD01085769.1.p1 GENE.GFUD01085769.1~~GFUD01085769.1.p1  ORF type:complete len:226 (+),score=32.98 GFUD01085769.1:132-809(+)
MVSLVRDDVNQWMTYSDQNSEKCCVPTSSANLKSTLLSKGCNQASDLDLAAHHAAINEAGDKLLSGLCHKETVPSLQTPHLKKARMNHSRPDIDKDEAHPVEHHPISNWVNMSIAPEQQPVLILLALLNPKAGHEKMTQIMFKTINLWAFLSIYASGRTTGIVLDSGDGDANNIPDYSASPHAFVCLDLDGSHLTNSLMENFTQGFTPPIVKGQLVAKAGKKTTI